MKHNILGSYRHWHIGNDVRGLMLEDERIVEMVGHKIYPLVAPEGTEGTFIVYSRENTSKIMTSMGVACDKCKVAITIVSDNYDDSIDLAEIVDDCLCGSFVIEDGTKIKLTMTDASESYEDNKYVQVLLFDVL